MKKHLALILFILILSLSIAACANDTPSETDAVKVESDSETEAETEGRTYPEPTLPDYVAKDGEYFTVLVRKNNGAGCDDIFGEVDSGDTLKEAVYLRNLILEDKYNLTVREMAASDEEVNPTLYNSVASNEHTYDLIDVNFLQTYYAASNGLLLDLLQVENLNMENPWWDKQINEDCTLGGKMYYAVGDANVTAVKGTWVLAFNKKLISDMGYEESYLYDLVRDGKWTIEEYYKLVKGFAKDLDNDNKMTAADRYALAGNGSSLIGFMSCAGVEITTKNEDDLLEFVNLEDSVNDMLIELGRALSPDFTYNIDHPQHFATDGGTSAHIDIFREDRALFFSECLTTMEVFRDMESNFGIVPHPKYREEDEYSSFLHHHAGTAFGIPITAPDLTKTAVIMEYMSYLSTDSVLPIYYSRVLEGKNTRDTDSYEMITEYMMPKRKYDIGFSNAFGNLMFDIYAQINNGTTAYASTYRAARANVLRAVDEANLYFGE